MHRIKKGKYIGLIFLNIFFIFNRTFVGINLILTDSRQLTDLYEIIVCSACIFLIHKIFQSWIDKKFIKSSKEIHLLQLMGQKLTSVHEMVIILFLLLMRRQNQVKLQTFFKDDHGTSTTLQEFIDCDCSTLVARSVKIRNCSSTT